MATPCVHILDHCKPTELAHLLRRQVSDIVLCSVLSFEEEFLEKKD
jgi:hypothetical protein